MKKRFAFSATALATFVTGVSLAFDAQFADVVTTQDDTTGEVTVRYRLTGDPCIVTMDVQTNRTKNSGWFSLADTERTGITGDVWKVVLPNSFFGGYNPYNEILSGDWMVSPDPCVAPHVIISNTPISWKCLNRLELLALNITKRSASVTQM